MLVAALISAVFHCVCEIEQCAVVLKQRRVLISSSSFNFR